MTPMGGGEGAAPETEGARGTKPTGVSPLAWG